MNFDCGKIKHDGLAAIVPTGTSEPQHNVSACESLGGAVRKLEKRTAPAANSNCPAIKLKPTPNLRTRKRDSFRDAANVGGTFEFFERAEGRVSPNEYFSGSPDMAQMRSADGIRQCPSSRAKRKTFVQSEICAF